MQLEGSFEVPAARDDVYGFLTDWSRVAPILPDVSSYEVQDADTVALQARVGVSAIQGVMRSRLTIVDREPGRRAQYRGRATGLGSNVDLEMSFRLEDAGSGTEVQWSGTANIAGRLATVTAGLLEPIARKNLEVFVDAVQGGLGSELAADGAAEPAAGGSGAPEPAARAVPPEGPRSPWDAIRSFFRRLLGHPGPAG
jgi:uncharacterized protein